MHVAHDAHIDDFDRVETEVAQVVMHAALDIFRFERRQPRAVVAANRADLRDDHEVVRIRMQRLANQLVGDMRPVKVAGIDVIHARRHRLAQHRERGVAVFRRAEHAGPGQLHGAVTHAPHRAAGQREGVVGSGVRHEALLDKWLRGSIAAIALFNKPV